MTFNYTLSWVMTTGHKIAGTVREAFNTYKEALSKGLRKAWKMAKGEGQVLTIGQRLQVAMEQKGWGKDMLSRLTGVSTYRITKIMNGSLEPGVGELHKLCKELGIDEDQL